MAKKTREAKYGTCPACAGTGKHRVVGKCPMCGGKGKVPVSVPINVPRVQVPGKEAPAPDVEDSYYE